MNDKLTMTVQEIMDLGFSNGLLIIFYLSINILWSEVVSISITIKDLELFQYQLQQRYLDWRNSMSKTRYTEKVTKDDKTGRNILIILKLELTQLLVTLSRTTWFSNFKASFEARSIEQGTTKGGIKHTQWTLQFMEEALCQIITLQQVRSSNTDGRLYSMNLFNTLQENPRENYL